MPALVGICSEGKYLSVSLYHGREQSEGKESLGYVFDHKLTKIFLYLLIIFVFGKDMKYFTS